MLNYSRFHVTRNNKLFATWNIFQASCNTHAHTKALSNSRRGIQKTIEIQDSTVENGKSLMGNEKIVGEQ